LRDCTRDNATAVMRVQAKLGNPATCFMHGQAHLTETSIGRESGSNEQIKLFAREDEVIDASMPIQHVDSA
jgi:hypothetical protein